jgi:hypothetical protein
MKSGKCKMAKYYVIKLSCGCTFTSGVPMEVGKGVTCSKHHSFSTIVECIEYTTM